jgi:hypothetical protein
MPEKVQINKESLVGLSGHSLFIFSFRVQSNPLKTNNKAKQFITSQKTNFIWFV